MTYHPEMVSHPDSPECPGHDINLILGAKSREVGYCLCIHPFAGMIDFAGLVCDWCGQKFTDQSKGPGAKEVRTMAVRDVLGTGPGGCSA